MGKLRPWTGLTAEGCWITSLLVKQMDPKRIFFDLTLDEGNTDYLADPKQKKRKEKGQEGREPWKDTNLYTWSSFL